MINFLRKHQRIFFIFITFIIVISFCFFGTFSAIMSDDRAPDKVIAKAIDGSDITQRQIDAMTRFLASGHESRGAFEQGKMVNLLNDGVICKDFLMTGMGVMLAEKYFEELKPDLEPRFKKAKHYRPYMHPQAPFVSAQMIWQYVAPQMSRQLAEIKLKCDTVSPETFALLSNLYVEQASFPPEMLKKFLGMQQKQCPWAQPDPELEQGNLALFGFLTTEDWFGPRYLELVSQFVINASILAEQKGYKVSYDEARAELLQNTFTGMQGLIPEDQLSYQAAQEFCANQMRYLGLDEITTVKIWRSIMLFRRLFNDVGNAVFLDPLSYQQFASHAKEAVSVDLYQLPEELRFKDFYSLLKLQVYLDTVSKNRGSLLALPKSFFTADELEKRCPQLVQRRFSLEFSETSRDAIAQKISLKETWAWELEENNWPELARAFPALASCNAKTREERYGALEKIGKDKRLEIDRFARLKIVDSHPEWIEEALSAAPKQQQWVSIRTKGGSLPFEGVFERSELVQELDKGAVLEKFTEDKEHFYRITVLKNTPAKEVLTFAEAVKDDTLSELLDQKIEKSYPDVRGKDPEMFRKEDGTWKSFREVKDKIGTKIYADLLKAIAEDYEQATGKEAKDTPDFYVAHRFHRYMRDTKKQLEANPENPALVRLAPPSFDDEAPRASPEAQWQLVKNTTDIKRSSKEAAAKEDLFKLTAGNWSSVTASQGTLSFCRIVERPSKDADIQEEISKGHQRLAIDAKRCLMQKVLAEIEK